MDRPDNLSPEDEHAPRRVFVPARIPSSIQNQAVPFVLQTEPSDDPNWQQVGSTDHFTVFYDTNQGPACLTSAQAVLYSCEVDYSSIQICFPQFNANFNVFVGSFDGAYHNFCSGTDIYCDYQGVFGSDGPSMSPYLVTAEIVEVFEAMQNAGWDCSTTNGEGLSQVLAAKAEPYLAAYHTVAPEWLDNGRPDFITANDPELNADQNLIADGCAVLFLNWLAYELGYSTYGWRTIVQAAGASLAQTYTNLTGRTDAVQRFQAAMQARFPAGTPSDLSLDNPYPLRGLRVFYLKQDGSVGLTTRHFDGSWSPYYEFAPPAGALVEVSCTKVNHPQASPTPTGYSEFHVCFLNTITPGQPFQGFMQANGEWNGPYDIKQEVFFTNPTSPDPGSITKVCCGSSQQGELQVFLINTQEGALWHTIRTAHSEFDDYGTWAAFTGVNLFFGLILITDVACASPASGEMQVCIITQDGELWHTIRSADGSWTFPGDVKGQAGDPGIITDVACASSTPGELQVCVVTSDGGLWHTTRHADGSWDHFDSVKNWAGDPGPGVAVGCSDTGNQDELHICFVTQDGSLWHAIELSPQVWVPFIRVQDQDQDPNLVQGVSCARASNF